jgi:hypothetical protein
MSEASALLKVATALDEIILGAGPTIRVSTAELVELAGLVRQVATPPAQPVDREPAYLMKLYRVDEVEGLRQQVGELEAALDHADARILELVAEVGTRQQRMGELLANYSPEQYVKKYEELVQALTEISKGGGGWTLWQIAARALSNSAGKEGAK